jgi:hypothetical protein
MRKAFTHRQRLSITLYDLDNGNASEDVKLIRVTSQSFGITALATCLLFCGQTVTQ